jgi:hypothetical protein
MFMTESMSVSSIVKKDNCHLDFRAACFTMCLISFESDDYIKCKTLFLCSFGRSATEIEKEILIHRWQKIVRRSNKHNVFTNLDTYTHFSSIIPE